MTWTSKEVLHPFLEPLWKPRCNLATWKKRKINVTAPFRNPVVHFENRSQSSQDFRPGSSFPSPFSSDVPHMTGPTPSGHRGASTWRRGRWIFPQSQGTSLFHQSYVLIQPASCITIVSMLLRHRWENTKKLDTSDDPHIISQVSMQHQPSSTHCFVIF